MIILAFDTSLAACSAAVADCGKTPVILSATCCEPGRGHAEILLNMICEVMSQAGTGFEDINHQIITTGPGSFTGVRVGLSAARGFNLAHGIPICGLSTMQAIAANCACNEPDHSATPIAVIVDARRHQVYGQVFDAALRPLCTPQLIATDELYTWLQPWQDSALKLIGSGVGLIEASGACLPENWEKLTVSALPDAASFAIAFKDLKPEETPPEPLYLRQPDAKPQTIGQKTN